MRTSLTIERLVVYGTLLRDVGHPCHAILAALSEFEGRVHFRGELYDLGEYPAVRTAPGVSDIVHGELYRLLRAQDILTELDAYEGYDPCNPTSSLYCREAVAVFQARGNTVRAWVYRYNGSVTGKPRIISGDYLDYRRRRRAVSAHCG